MNAPHIAQTARRLCHAMSDAQAERIARLAPDEIPVALSEESQARWSGEDLERLRAELSRLCRLRVGLMAG